MPIQFKIPYDRIPDAANKYNWNKNFVGSFQLAIHRYLFDNEKNYALFHFNYNTKKQMIRIDYFVKNVSV